MATSDEIQYISHSLPYANLIVYVDKAINLSPNLNMGYGLAGNYYMQLNEPDLAIEYYLKAIKLPPKHANWRWYHSGIGRAYLTRNEAIKALPYLQKGIEGEFDEDLGGSILFHLCRLHQYWRL